MDIVSSVCYHNIEMEFFLYSGKHSLFFKASAFRIKQLHKFSSDIITSTVNTKLRHQLNEPARKYVRSFSKKAHSDTLDHLKSWRRSLITAKAHTGGLLPDIV